MIFLNTKLELVAAGFSLRFLEDAVASIINAVEAGLTLKEDALFHESATAKPYIGDKEREDLKTAQNLPKIS